MTNVLGDSGCTPSSTAVSAGLRPKPEASEDDAIHEKVSHGITAALAMERLSTVPVGQTELAELSSGCRVGAVPRGV